MKSYKIEVARDRGNPVYGSFVVYAETKQEAIDDVKDFIDEMSCGQYSRILISVIEDFE